MVSGTNLFRAVLSLAWIASLAEAYPTPMQVNYTDVNDPNYALMGYMTLPPNVAAMDDSTDDVAFESVGMLPAVVILPDWDNVNDYEITRASMISEELGYIAFTADIYGADMHDIQDFGVKVEQATKYRSDVALFNSRIESAVATIKGMPFVDPSRVAVIGYCLGGTGVLSYSFANTMGSTTNSMGSIVGGVSFHGGLMEFNVTGEMASPVLVLSGGNDDAGTDVEALEGRLKEANATWQITRYSGVFHGFTKFDSDAYNEWVDMRSWMEMSSFLKELFGEITYGTVEPTVDTEYLVNPTEVGMDSNVARQATNDTMITVETVAYDDNGFALEGYLALPPMAAGETRPAILILPDWDGVNGPTGYEAERAVLAAKEGGYVAMVADIYGTEYTDVMDFNVRIEQSTFYRSDPELYVQRIQTGVDQLLAHPAVDSSRIFVAGYCFGGTGSIDYAFSSAALKNVRAVVPIHGGLTPLRAVQTDAVEPYVLILSGGVDDAHGNPTELEAHLDAHSATWEISRYSNAQHGFTKWGTGDFSPYDPMADSRSWWSMMSLFDTLSTMELEEVEDSEPTMVANGDDESSMPEKMEGDHEGHDHDGEDHSLDEMAAGVDDSSASTLSVFGAMAMASLMASFMY